ncbi:MAG: transposase [Candidatus Thermoplasmatota archaeon]|nr:transposase [Candidatus Thermoplasmatota archaeon]
MVCTIDISHESKRGRDDLFRFVINREVESTNNRAERAIRPIVTYRKVSGGSRCDKGASDFSIVYTVMETRRKRNNSWLRLTPNLASNS